MFVACSVVYVIGLFSCVLCTVTTSVCVWAWECVCLREKQQEFMLQS